MCSVKQLTVEAFDWITDNMNMGGKKSKKTAGFHRPNGLIAKFRAEAPAENKDLIRKKNKEARASLKEAAKLGKSVIATLSRKTINRVLASD